MKKIIVPLDGMDRASALDLAIRLAPSPYLWGFKGHDLLLEGDMKETIMRFTAIAEFFVDLKFCDIPNTVANEVAKIASYGASLFTMHASGGPEMVEAGVKAFDANKRPGALGALCVTLLTSINEETCFRIYNTDPKTQVREMAKIAKEAGAWGVVCSPEEVGTLSTDTIYKGLSFVTPALRPVGSDPGDQKRFSTPEQAFANGATLGVIGRPITGAPDPLAALNAIGKSIMS